jgi:SAM-dependent methyltransferase
MSESTTATVDEIHDYWKSSAKAAVDQDGLKPTARDPYLQAAVETAIESKLPKSGVLFDFGCGDGASTARFAPHISKAYGFDYIPAYVEMAKKAHPTLTFAQADVRQLQPIVRDYGQADIAISIRCLINLPTWELQRAAIDQIAATIKPGGVYLFSEGWQEGWDALNVMRHQLSLPPINLVSYNRLLSRQALESHVEGKFEIVDYVNLGFYIFMSRVLQPAFVAPNSPTHTHPLNRIGQEMLMQGIGKSEFADIDYAGVYVLRRRGHV